MQNSIVLSLLFCSCLFSCTKTAPKSRFSAISPEHSKLTFENAVPENGPDGMNIIQYLYYYNGGGVAAGDLNNDGWTDLYFSANTGDNKLYLNKGGFQFEDVTTNAGVAAPGPWKTGVNLADVNADGWLDIYLCRVGAYKKYNGRNALFINNQDGTFSEKAAEYGLDFAGFATQSAFFDFDLDGDLDCFLLCHSVHSPASYKEADFSRKFDPLSSDRLFRNDNGHFIDITQKSGLRDGASGYGLGLCIGDLNNDGYPDIYIANDFHENDYLYLNQNGKGFLDRAPLCLGHSSNFSMGCDLADFNNDGLMDLISLDMKPEEESILKASAPADPYPVFNFKHEYGYHWQFARNNLQLNLGLDATPEALPHFAEIGQLAGVASTDWSWSPLLADFDLDGLKDLYITNGIPRRPNDSDFNLFSSSEEVQRNASDQDLIGKMPPGQAKNYAFRNRDGLHFENRSEDWGLDLKSCSNGAVYADLDNDGDWDLVTNNLNQKAAVYRNETTGKNWLKIKLRQSNSLNSNALGARIEIETENGLQLQEVQPVRGFQSAVEPLLIFGLGDLKYVNKVKIRWPDGTLSVLGQTAVNQVLLLDAATMPVQPGKNLTPASLMARTPALMPLPYRDSTILGDIMQLKLLPWSLQERGSRWTLADVNGDGLTDLLHARATLLQQPDGAFTPHNSQHPFAPFVQENTTCIRPSDFDLDGDTDYFIGNRFDPFAYGIGVRSILLENKGNNQLVEVALEALKQLPECADARWLDLDKDKFPELLIAGNWMPLSVLKKGGDAFQLLQIEGTDGLWNCLSEPTDADGDGDLDLAAGNWGLNSNLQASAREPLGLWVKDFDGNGSFDPLIAYYRQGKKYVFQDKNLLVSQMPSFKKRYLDFKKYAESDFYAVFDKKSLQSAVSRQAIRLSSVFVENNGTLMPTLHDLPAQAQFSLALAAVFYDLDNDGIKDLVLAGNQHAIQPAIGSMDAMPGCFLHNDGKAHFTPIVMPAYTKWFDGNISDLNVFDRKKHKVLILQKERQLWLGEIQ